MHSIHSLAHHLALPVRDWLTQFFTHVKLEAYGGTSGACLLRLSDQFTPRPMYFVRGLHKLLAGGRRITQVCLVQ